MQKQLRRYGLTLGVLMLAAALRLALIPVLGYRYGFTLFLVATFVCGKYFGLGSSIFALVVGAAAGIALHFVPPDQRFDSSLQFATALYLVLGVLIVVLRHSGDQLRSALQRARSALQSTMADYRDSRQQLLLAIEAAHLGIWTFDLRSGRVQWSGMMEAMHGYEPGTFDGTLSGAIAHNHPEDQQRIMENIESKLESSGMTYRVIGPDNRVRWIEGMGRMLRDATGEPVHMVGVCADVTERREAEIARHQAEQALRSSEQRLQAIINNTVAVIYLKDTEGRYLMVNRQWEELFGFTQQQIAGRTDDDIFAPEVVDPLRANDRRVRDTGRSLEFEEAVPQSDGLHTYISVKFPLFDSAGRCYAVGGISTDISDRKRAADALATEQELLRHTIEFQDHERQLIAYEIHDGLVQYATGALMQLEAIRDELESNSLRQKFDNVVNILQRTVVEGRRLINGIRTPVLDDWGVVAAVEQLLDEEDRAHVEIEFVKDHCLGRMAPNIEEALYRITQEALTNVGKHSQSKNVRIEIGRQGDRVRLEVRDWGIGFTPIDGDHRVHGLKGMTKRARMAGGRCTIESTPGAGTRVVVDLPYMARN